MRVRSADEPAFECALATELGVVSLDEVVDAGDDVAAMRVASTGWEIHVLRGASRLLACGDPANRLGDDASRASARPQSGRIGSRDARETLEWLFSLGYADVAHSGEACEERWRNITRYVDSRGGLGLEFATGRGNPRGVTRRGRIFRFWWRARAPRAGEHLAASRLERRTVSARTRGTHRRNLRSGGGATAWRRWTRTKGRCAPETGTTVRNDGERRGRVASRGGRYE